MNVVLGAMTVLGGRPSRIYHVLRQSRDTLRVAFTGLFRLDVQDQ